MSEFDRIPIIPIPIPIKLPPWNGGPGPVMPPWNQNNPGQGPGPIFPPLSENPNNQNRLIIKMKSVFVDRFVQVGVNGYLYARGEYFEDGQVFTMILLDRNQVKIRVRGGNFIRINSDGFLIADTDNRGASIFNVYSVNRNEYAVMAPNGYYVRVRDKDNMLVARAENAGPRTIFKFRKLEDY